MNRTIGIISAVIVYATFFITYPVWSQKNRVEAGWKGKLKNGTTVTANDLKKLLGEHERWHRHAAKIAKAYEQRRSEALMRLEKIADSVSLIPVNLSGSDLRGADLRGVNLGSPLSVYDSADLSGANLGGANLNGADLTGADLSNANLVGAILDNADLSGAKLKDAHLGETNYDEPNYYYKAAKLNGANLTGVDLNGANFFLADLSKAILTRAILSKANLQGASLMGVDFRKASLSEADLRGADLEGADLRGVDLKGADLNNCKLAESDLRSAILNKADLSNAELREANLSRSSLIGANLEGADLMGANLFSANLSEANFEDADLSLADLRLANLTKADLKGTILFGADFSNAFLDNTIFMATPGHPEFQISKRLSHRDSERLNAYHREARKWSRLVVTKSFYNRLISWLQLIFFDLPCQYGMSPGRSLIILMCLIPYFAIFYLLALRSHGQKTGLWLILSGACVRKTDARERRFKLYKKFPPRPLPFGHLNKLRIQILYWCRMIRISFFFSLLSAFRIGLGDLRWKRWIIRGQARGYTIRATGWARNLSVIQCLLSTYLLLLWVLTTFSNPF